LIDAEPHAPEIWYTAVVGSSLAALALLVELLNGLLLTAFRRSAFGFNALVQIFLAVVLLVGVNLASTGLTVPVPATLKDRLGLDKLGVGDELVLPGYNARIDLTRDQQFTLPDKEKQELARLDRRAVTQIVVYRLRKTFGNLTDTYDYLDDAAERKVVEKVKDLVGLLREVGPQLRVEVLERWEEGYEEKLARLTAGAPALRKAIESAPENSIFIQDGDHVQQMSFNEFYQLDRSASTEANDRRGNLVLLGQGGGRGVEPFVRRILDLEQRVPRVGILVVHELLTTEGTEDVFTLAGLRQTLTANGFEVRDVVLRKGWERVGATGMLEPAADTFEESNLDRLDFELARLEAFLRRLDAEINLLRKRQAELEPTPGEDEKKKLAELSETYAALLGGEKMTARDREALLEYTRDNLARREKSRSVLQSEHEQVRAERGRLDIDRISESRRMTDVKAKLSNMLADCDLIVVPRLTRRVNGEVILPRLHRIDQAQAQAIREYLESGKPLLACLGPVNEPPGLNAPPSMLPMPDPFEDLLTDLGFHLGKQTVLFNADIKSLTDRRPNLFRTSGKVEVPLLDFKSSPADALGAWLTRSHEHRDPSRLREGLHVLAQSVGRGLDVRLRFPRPVYFEPKDDRKTAYDPTFLLTAIGSNEDDPFPSDNDQPAPTSSKSDSAVRGNLDARRLAPFPVGVAADVVLPISWGRNAAVLHSAAWAWAHPPATVIDACLALRVAAVPPNADTRTDRVRVAVIGQGDVFVGSQLSPARERLFLQTANWLLGRDEALPRAAHPWSYPRVALLPGSEEHNYWLWGTRLGLPVLFAYFGCVVLLWRRLR
jgi:hypothetical protein